MSTTINQPAEATQLTAHSSFNELVRAKLRVKIKSLAVEAKIIRREEHKSLRTAAFNKRTGVPSDNTWFGHDAAPRELYLHRVINVREEARASLLAYAFLRGKPYKHVEPNSRKGFDFNKVARICQRMTFKMFKDEEIESWVNA